ncbi:MAG: hypothetical protein ACOYJV_02535 [Aminivibrio sp.]|jgi:lipopolysaccharide export system protein LptA
MKYARFCATAFVMLLFILSPVFAQDLELVSDKMRYESESGDFWAEGDVKVTRGTLMADSKTAEGNMNRREFIMKGSVHVHGAWMEDKVDMKGQILSGTFSEPREYIFDGGVKGFWGPREIDAAKLRMKGDYFWGTKIKKYADKKEGYLLTCDAAEGKLSGGELEEFTATGNVYFLSTPKGGEPTEIRGNKAVYSKARGTLVVSGGVTALQAGRSLTSSTLIFFPDKNRVEATGKPRLIFKSEEDKDKK